MKLLEKPSQDPSKGLISRIKLSLAEMYMNEYYEPLSKNFVVMPNGRPHSMLYMFYHTKSKLPAISDMADRKVIEAVLGGTEVDIHSFPPSQQNVNQ